MSHKIKSILALAAHPDDIEFACGGTINRFIEEQKDIWYVVLSPCIKSLPKGSDDYILYEELNRSATRLGIPKNNIIKFQFPVRDFPAHRQEILEHFIELKKKINPDLVLLPNSKDIHQDHKVIYEEGIRGFKNSCMLGYELPWNNFVSELNYFVKLEERHLETKLEAIKEYKTQKNRYYNSGDFFYDLAAVRGVQVNTKYAEAFEIIRYIY